MFIYSYASSICEEIPNEELKNKCEIIYEEEINRDKILDKIFIFYNSIFLIEMISKMIAQGLILHKRSYLRNGWNILDCFITVYSIFEIFFTDIDKTTALRVIRLLRVIKEIVHYEGLRRLITSIIISFPTLGNVFLFLGFIFIVFATFGIQLFSGVYYSRCRLPPVEIIRNDEIFYSCPPIFDRLCSNPDSGGLFKCTDGLHCVNFYDIPTYFNLTEKNVTIEMFDINEEKLNENPYFNYGVLNFDNILNCLINVFCFMTYQNWAEIYSILIDGVSPLACGIFFNVIVIVGGFFVMKLILAAQTEAMIKVRVEELDIKIKLIKRISVHNKFVGLEDGMVLDVIKNIDNIRTTELIENAKRVDINLSEDDNNREEKIKNIYDENETKNLDKGNLISCTTNQNNEKENLNMKRDSTFERDIAKSQNLNFNYYLDGPTKNKKSNQKVFKYKKNNLNSDSDSSSDSEKYKAKDNYDLRNSNSISNSKSNYNSNQSEDKTVSPTGKIKKSNFYTNPFDDEDNTLRNSSLVRLTTTSYKNPQTIKNLTTNPNNKNIINSLLAEKITYQQNRNIILIENFEFEHSCKHFKQNIKKLIENKVDVDLFLQDCFNFDLNCLFDDNESKIINSDNLINNSQYPHNPALRNNFFNYSSLKNSNNLKAPSIINKFNSKLTSENNKTLNERVDEFKNYLTGKFGNVKKMAQDKIKYLILEEFSHTSHYIVFNLFIYSITLVNLIFLSMMTYPMTEETVDKIKVTNIFCSSVFLIEIIFKLFVLGIKGFFVDKLNVMDFVVVNLGIVEILAFRINADPNDDANSSLSSFRALRFIRLLKLFKKGFIQRFVNFIIISLRDLLNYCFLLCFFIVLFSIGGREIFANHIKLITKFDKYGFYYDGNVSPRENFDTIFDSFLTVFILFIGDSWPKIMYEYARLYPATSFAFFISIIIFGNIMLFNLFLSIMLSNYDTEYAVDILNLDETPNNGIGQNIKKIERTFKGVYQKVKSFYKKILECCGDKDEEEELKMKATQMQSLQLKKRQGILPVNMTMIHPSEGEGECDATIESVLQLKINLEKLKDLIPMIRKSLFIFPKTSRFREWCRKISMHSKIFENYLMINILISLLILCLDSPSLQDCTLKKILYSFDLVTTVAFIIEMLLKIVAFGFLFNGKYSYIRHGFNIIDFASVCLSISYLIVNISVFECVSKSEPIYNLNNISSNIINALTTKTSTTQQVFKVIKILRILRVFKLIERSRSLRATFSAFYVSLKEMLTIIMIGSLFIFMFSIVGITYFRGLFNRCDYTNVPLEFMYQIKNKWDCIDFGGEWVTPYPNFDNINTSFILLFEMMTTESWTSFMYSAMDSTEINFQPTKNNRGSWALFFILYMIFAYFFLLNSAISILSDNFKKEKAEIEKVEFKIPIQKEFFTIYKNLYKVKIPKNATGKDKLSKILLNILDSIYFDVIISACIISNLGMLMLNLPSNDERTNGFIFYMNSIFNYVFIFEAFLKIYVFRFSYFSSGWNVLDFILVSDTLINLLLKQLITLFNNVFDTSILRAIRVARILRILKKAKSLNRIFNLFLNSIPGVINIGILYFIFIFIYSVVGMNLFSLVKHQKIIGEKWNFKDLTNSILMLIRLTSGEGWNTVMHECFKERDGNYFCIYYEEMTDEQILNGNIGCGSSLSTLYFLSFIILSNMMFLQFFSVIITSTVSETYFINLEELKKAQLNKFKRKWVNYDKECTGFMALDSFQKFLFEIGYPLGISSMRISDYIKVISILDIYSYEDKKLIFFYDALTELTKYYMIHRQIEEEYGDGKLFENLEETVEKKSQLFETLNNEISELKQNVKIMLLDPYYNTNKYKKVKRDKLQIRVKFSNSEYLRLHYAWAIKKISKFTRLYEHMKAKTLKLMEREMFIDEIFLYSAKYQDYMNGILNDNQNLFNYKTIHEVEEENSSSSRNSKSNSLIKNKTSDLSNSIKENEYDEDIDENDNNRSSNNISNRSSRSNNENNNNNSKSSKFKSNKETKENISAGDYRYRDTNKNKEILQSSNKKNTTTIDQSLENNNNSNIEIIPISSQNFDLFSFRRGSVNNTPILNSLQKRNYKENNIINSKSSNLASKNENEIFLGNNLNMENMIYNNFNFENYIHPNSDSLNPNKLKNE